MEDAGTNDELQPRGDGSSIASFTWYIWVMDHDDGGGGDDDNDSTLTPTPTSTTPLASNSTSATPTTSSNSSSNPIIGMHGDVVCTDLLCVGALVNGTTVQYTLQSLDAASLGWMAMGFGSQMANTPMVIMWPNTDGTVTLSQRKAPAEVMPTVDSNPPRIATLESSLSDLSGSNPKLVFSIPANSDTTQDIIWAFSSTNPDDSAADATLIQHLNSGPTQLDLTNVLTASSMDPTNPVLTLASGPNSNSGGGSTSPVTTAVTFKLPPLLPYEKYIVAHAILCVIGFLGLLPLGAIVARWIRTFNPVWFRLHWIIQFGLALPVIVAGVACGITAVHMGGMFHLNDTHMKWGVAIFVLYFFQITLGAFIHFWKPKRFAAKNMRPPQNYFHAIIGILIIGVAFYQVRTGFRQEWLIATGRLGVGNGANIIWIIWLVLIPAIYFSGMILLRRQYRQEREGRKVGLASAPTDGDGAVDLRTRTAAEF
ncbi:hypothetical protein PHLCEN_2v1476 [Hermanssonia centrifuga]|uniref:Cytochrome b561 domain-containing protein n=1 Tax=Hermanssonia centrifuga TaxID=98765 RepID=A0A2R6RZV5_9APHY|nr:hypothetical protein PHLCEN_2v1476 [Hermanssonia centrifuga]